MQDPAKVKQWTQCFVWFWNKKHLSQKLSFPNYPLPHWAFYADCFCSILAMKFKEDLFHSRACVREVRSMINEPFIYHVEWQTLVNKLSLQMWRSVFLSKIMSRPREKESGSITTKIRASIDTPSERKPWVRTGVSPHEPCTETIRCEAANNIAFVDWFRDMVCDWIREAGKECWMQRSVRDSREWLRGGQTGRQRHRCPALLSALFKWMNHSFITQLSSFKL